MSERRQSSAQRAAYCVALIQNQSEMSHYGYADAQNLMAELGYPPTLFTADNLDDLVSGPIAGEFDAIVVASNALNDEGIRSRLLDGAMNEAVKNFVAAGGGLACLHQFGLSMSRATQPLSFLPEPLGGVVPIRRPPTESNGSGSLALTGAGSQHVIMQYPHPVHPADLHATAMPSGGALRGLYWHYWENARLADWDVLLEDALHRRPLILAAKESSMSRVVLSALTLDWQQHRALLMNVLTYVAEGRHAAALVASEHRVADDFVYLSDVMRSRRLAHRMYLAETDELDLRRNVANGVHSALVAADPSVVEVLDSSTTSLIRRRVTDGALRFMILGRDPEYLDHLTVADGFSPVNELVDQFGLQVQVDLTRGYLDGSLWSTAEVLRVVHETEDVGGSLLERMRDLAAAALTEIDGRDLNGSYAGTFGATCASLYIRYLLLGRDHAATVGSLRWIRENLSTCQDRERALAYEVLAQCGVLSADEADAFRALLDTVSTRRLSQTDLVAYLRGAVTVRHVAILPTLVNALYDNLRVSTWEHLAIAAEAATRLVAAKAALEDRPEPAWTEVVARGRELSGQVVLEIQDRLRARRHSPSPYVWDGKASTTAKCLQAWLAYEADMTLPVHTAVDILELNQHRSSRVAASHTSLSVFDQLREESSGARERIDALQTQLVSDSSLRRRMARMSIRLRLVGGLLFLTLYAFGVLLVGVLAGADKVRGSLLFEAFAQSWTFHLTVASLIAALLAVPWGKVLAGRERTTGND